MTGCMVLENVKPPARKNGKRLPCEVLQVENAKLRRLARQMYPYAKANLQLGVALGCNDTMSYDWALQMVELGIEVPE